MSEAKFCIDRNKTRWVLLEGVINRKTPRDDPDKGMNLPVERVRGIEKTTVTRTLRSPLAPPAITIGLALILVAVWLATGSLLAAAPLGFIGLALLIWGAKHAAQKETYDAYQILANDTNPEDWLILGSHPEVEGFVNGLRAELSRRGAQQEAVRN